MMHVADLRRHHLALGRTGEEEKLIRLVRSDVAEDAAVARAFEEPGRPRLGFMRCGPRPTVWMTPPIAPAFTSSPGLHGGPVLEPLAVHDRVDALRLRLHATNLRQLLERRDARLVGHVVLAVLHHADAERRALVGNAGAQDELNGFVVEDLALAARELRLRIPLGEGCQQIGLLREDGHQLAAATDDRVSTWLLMCEWLMPMTANLIFCVAAVELPPACCDALQTSRWRTRRPAATTTVRRSQQGLSGIDGDHGAASSCACLQEATIPRASAEGTALSSVSTPAPSAPLRQSVRCSICPVLSPTFSACTPTRSSSVRYRFVIGVSLG